MNRADLTKAIQSKRSFLCVGLDTDPDLIPSFLRSEPDPIFTFNKSIIDATHAHCIAYKPNLAFYEALGGEGWEALQKTIEYIPDTHFTIADAKRGDIGNTSKRYAEALLNRLGFDSITVAPYMGEDSVTPFLADNKWVILLGLTSNPGSSDFQRLKTENGLALFEQVILKAQKWASPEQLMFVIGATHPEDFSRIRELAPDNFYLVPGIGAQGGDLEGLCKAGMNRDCGLLVNSSRGIIYAGNDKDFAVQAGKAAETLAGQMGKMLDQYLPA
ncbi:MAG: orotidine-5'-phosphate decarboxylase [Limisphaerales bacterium]|jgi:orotidine-5'-phosphate decarboxylase